MPIQAGKLRDRIRIERRAAGADDYGGESGAWPLLATRWAWVANGTGQERREAAQESATAPATFRVRRDSVTRTVTAKDRIRFDPFGPLSDEAPIWDISSAVPFELDAIDITATRKANPSEGE